MLIGFYKEANLHKIVRKERLLALSEEAIKQGDTLLVFELSGVNFLDKTVTGEILVNNKWEKDVYPLPKVIINEAPKLKKNRNPLEDELRSLVPFTTYLIGHKQDIYKKISGNAELKKLLIPTQNLNHVDVLISFLDQFNPIIAKPLNGRQGKGIFKITKVENSYLVDDSINVEKLSVEELINKFADLMDSKKYILQKFIECKTKTNQVYDFRIHVQRNGEGQWGITKIYPRIGSENSFLSNISQGGFTEDINVFLQNEFHEQSSMYRDLLEENSLKLADYINSFYSFTIDELGIDLAIDVQGDSWFYEANAGPQSKYHEEERAVNTIAYAKYVANHFHTKKQGELVSVQNRIMKTDDENRKTSNENITIGMMTSRKIVTYFTSASAAAAKFYDAKFFYFTPDDIDYAKKEIIGTAYEEGEWIKKTYNYMNDVDVIFDRLRKVGRAKFKDLYKELSHIPFTHTAFGTSINKLNLYNKFNNVAELKNYIIPFKEIKSHDEMNEFLNEYNEIIIKPLSSSQGSGIVYLSKVDNAVLIKDKTINLTLNPSEFDKWQEENVAKKGYVAQRFIQSRTLENQPFDIRVHMSRNGKGGWSYAAIYPRIGFFYEKISGTGIGGYIGAIDGFLRRQFGESRGRQIQKEIKKLSEKVVNEFEVLYKSNLSEAGMDIILDEKGHPYLLEVNVHQPGIIYYEFHFTKHMIAYAIYLAKNNK